MPYNRRGRNIERVRYIVRNVHLVGIQSELKATVIYGIYK